MVKVFTKRWSFLKKSFVVAVILLVVSIVTTVLSLREETSFLMYVAGIPLYFLLSRVRFKGALVCGVLFGILLAVPTHHWFTRYDSAWPYQAALGFYGVIFMMLFGIYAAVKKNTFTRIFLFGYLFYLVNFILHFVAYTKAFIKLVNNPTYVDFL